MVRYVMHIESVPNRNSRPAILLRESYREGGRVKKRTLANLSRWPEQRVGGLRTLLRGGVAVAKAEDALSIKRSLPHGHVAAILGSVRTLGLPELLTERSGGAAGRRCRSALPRPGAGDARRPSDRAVLETCHRTRS